MSARDDGGPAFPQDGGIDQLESPRNVQGMTLRDYFAAKAMEGFLASTNNGDCDTNTVAQSAYYMADAMLKARQA